MPAILGFPGKGLVSPTRVVLGAVAVALILLAGWHRDTLSTSSDLRHQLSKLTSYRSASLNDVSKCAEVVNGQKRQLTQVFGEVLKGVHNIMLIGLPNHPNKGDSAIYHAQQLLFASFGIRTHYECGVIECSTEMMDATVAAWQHDHFAIVFVGGGNLGDLYVDEEDLKINVFERYSAIRTHIFPQSLKFRFEDRVTQLKKAFAGLTHPLNSLATRDLPSYEFAKTHFSMPNLRIDLTPDIAFFIGFRPDLREQLAPREPHDLRFFRRGDVEGSDWYWSGGAQDPHFPTPFVERLEAATGLGGLSALTGDWVDEDLTDEERETGHAPSRAWRRFMMGAEWLSRSDYIILDRLHGHIVSLILGIPHILIDNNIGKLSAYHSTWTSECRLAHLAPEGGDQAEMVIKTYKSWVDNGKVSGRNYIAGGLH